MNSNIEVPKPRAIDRSKLSYQAAVKVPTPAVIDRSRLRYATAPVAVTVPQPAKIDRSKLSYLGSDSSIAREIPLPATIDRSKLVYQSASVIVPKAVAIDRTKLRYQDAITVPKPANIDRSKLRYQGPIVVPQPAVIERSKLVYNTPLIIPKAAKINRQQLAYTLAAGEIPRPRGIDRSQLVHLEPKLSVLEKNVHSPVTPGAPNFPKFKVTPELEAAADHRIAMYPAEEIRSAVLPLLHEVQHKFGFISPESITWVSGKLGIEPMKVVEVVTFYPGFRQKAPGKLHLRVCRTLSCAMGGSYELMDKLCQLTGTDRSKEDGHKDTISVSPCGNFSVEYAECLASCGTAPVCMVNDDFHEGITADKAEALLETYQNA